MARESQKAKSSPSSTTTSDNKIPDRLSKVFIASSVIGLGVLGWGAYLSYQHRDNMVMSLYRRLDGTLFQPSYLPIQTADEIRLLILEPGKGNDAIRCRLKHVSLSDNPKYEALSYVWGNPNKQGYIYCDGKRVRIGKELFNALGSLRESDRERVIWADALCINQGDNIEKGKQVDIMGGIYASSQHVLIWLGVPTSRTDGALEALREVDRYLKRIARGYKDGSFDWLRPQYAPRFSQGELQQLCQYDWASIFTLLKHPWPRRVWTLQEMAKAPAAIMVHGRQSIPAWDFFRPLTYVVCAVQGPEIAAHYSNTGASIETIQNFTVAGFENMMSYQVKPLLHMVAAHATTRGATNPRDRIYAFRSVSTDHDLSDWELLPDYDASVEEVYSRFARWCLLKKKNLAYLSYAGLPDQHEGPPLIGDFPSWVADWTRVVRVGFQHTLSAAPEPYKAGSALDPTIVWNPNQPRLLSIKGRVVDAVAEVAVTRADLLEYYIRSVHSPAQKYEVPLFLKLVARLFPFSTRLLQGLQEAQQTVSRYGPVKGPTHMLVDVIWIENCKAIATQGMSPISRARFDSFWRTMIRNRTVLGEEKTPRNSGKIFDEYLHFLNLVRDGKHWAPPSPGTVVARHEGNPPISPPAISIENSEIMKTRRLMHQYWGGIIHKRFCSTTEGRLGWVPDRARPGDLICIFDGATVPYVIRPRTEEGSGKLSLVYTYWYHQLSGYLLSPAQEVNPGPEYVLVGECYVDGLMDGEALDLESRFITLS
ncbi:hypothetical protein BO94DRAFT_462372 [Aspergillus sclerotioniger CBS 115572]|uniref:Heterokaryon incompatibility domain-containing protein n=1 Tax=Aspergillus sclerotioniger CBS 115572 TaxID=1450535 RepID=A0A317WYN0_9EURO|nr:hypothetical protein BO94DRAFT_462372 [Aspergillus sclerotioniger CBS 115572]PWY91506.1 hypothetical protein BO94DRAFT_462372 [Aspergillus sclerotioniger CBS 115572]